MREEKGNIKIKTFKWTENKIKHNYYELLWTQLTRERFGAIFVEKLLRKLKTKNCSNYLYHVYLQGANVVRNSVLFS